MPLSSGCIRLRDTKEQEAEETPAVTPEEAISVQSNPSVKSIRHTSDDGQMLASGRENTPMGHLDT